MKSIYNYLILLLFIPLLGINTAVAQDIALVGMTSNTGNDKFSFVALTNIPSGEAYYFTDDAYDPVTNSFDIASVESLYRFISPGVVIGDVIVVTETGASTNIVAETCEGSVGCGSTVTVLDPAVSLGNTDEIFCFSSTAAIGASFLDIFNNMDEIHSSIRGTAVTTPKLPTASYPNSINVILPGVDGQFNNALRGNVLTNADLSITSNYVTGDANSTIRFSQLNGATISGAEIQVIGYDTDDGSIAVINSGDITRASCSNNTYLLPNVIGSGADYYGFTIQNLGTANLTLTGAPNMVTITSSPPGFTIAQQPSGSVIPVGAQYDFGINFEPTIVGAHTAIITIANDDTDENPYTFIIEAEGVTTLDVPAIAIVGMASTITPDQFSFVALRDILPGEVFYFTDDIYDEDVDEFIHANGVESLFKYAPAATVLAGDVVVISEDVTQDVILVDCTDQCSDTDMTFSDPPFSLGTDDALYCFTTSTTSTLPVDIVSNIEQIHSSMAFASNNDYNPHSCRHPSALHVQLTSDNAQFNIALRETTALDDYAALENPANYVTGPASSTIPFNRITIGCGDQFVDEGGPGNPYAANTNTKTTICPDDPADVVYIDFTFVDIETAPGNGINNTGCWDMLTIYDGDSVDSTLIGSFCGEGDGDGSVPSVITNLLESGDQFFANNATGCLTFVFSSDGSVQEEGFEATITCGPPPTCPPPTNLTVSNITSTNINIGWQGSGSGNYLIEYGLTGFALGTGTTLGSLVNPTTAFPLTPGETYDFYVREVCSPGDTSLWAGPITETTPCVTPPGDLPTNAIPITLPITDEVYTNDLCYTNVFPDRPGNDVHFTFTTGATCTDSIYISTCSDTTNFDTVVRMLDSSGVEVGSNDDSLEGCDYLLNGANRFSIVRIAVVPNETYTIIVEGYAANDAGTFGLTVYEYRPGGNLEEAKTVASFPYTDIDSTQCFNNDFTNSPGNDVFYKFTTGACADTILISTCADTTNFDTFVYLLDENGDQLFNNDDSPFGTCGFTLNGANRFSILRAPVLPNTTYYVVVDGFGFTSIGNFEVTIDEICRPGVQVSPKVILEGPYNATTGLMGDDLRTLTFLPTVEPFTNLGFTHVGSGGGETAAASLFDVTGDEAIVDWVFLELHTETITPFGDIKDLVATRSALLQRDGDIVSHLDGVSPVEFTNAPDDDYFVVIKSRNHLSISTSTELLLTQQTETIVDFTTMSDTNTLGTDSQKAFTNGLFGLYEGDLDASGVIDASDRSISWNDRNQTGYLQEDSNMNGSVDASERSQTWNNRNKTETIPIPD